jgi:hypothetical protein
MKKQSILFLFLCSFLSVFSQIADDSIQITGAHIQLYDGTIYFVKKPVLICDSTVIFIEKGSNKVFSKEIHFVESISRSSSPRWITKYKLAVIGTSPVFGYMASIFLFFPPGIRYAILTDIARRQRIKKMYQATSSIL